MVVLDPHQVDDKLGALAQSEVAKEVSAVFTTGEIWGVLADMFLAASRR